MQIANISITIFNHRKVSNYNMSCLVLMNVLFQFLPTTMAEALLVDDNWSTEVELEHPDRGAPHPNGWEDDVQRRAREDLINQAGVVDDVQGDGPATEENTEQLAVSQEQVKTKFTCYNQTSV